MIDITLPDSVVFRGLFVTIGAVVVFYGSVYLLVYTNLGKKLGFLVAGVALFGWTTLNSLLFVLYAPRGPRPAIIDGLNFFEVRVIALSFTLGSLVLFAMFLAALNRFEKADSDTA